MKGWVYVITNPSMPGLCKVGFSMKDPELRAQELDNTGTPRPYAVEYEVLVEDPQRYEQMVHRKLEKEERHDAKEWFRCSPEEAVSEIKAVIPADMMIFENHKRIEKERKSGGREEEIERNRKEWAERLELVRQETVRQDIERRRKEKELEEIERKV